MIAAATNELTTSALTCAAQTLNTVSSVTTNYVTALCSPPNNFIQTFVENV